MRKFIKHIPSFHLLAMALFLLSTGQLMAQEPRVPRSEVGIKLGGNSSRVGFDPGLFQELDFGVVGGLAFRHFAHKNMGILVELNYMQAGWTEAHEGADFYYRELDYIQLPVMTHAMIGQRGFRVLINLGPYVGALVREKEAYYFFQEAFESPNLGRGIDNKLEFGLCLGVGFSINTAIGVFQAEGRVNYALSNLYERDWEDGFTTSSNQHVEITLSYFLGLGK